VFSQIVTVKATMMKIAIPFVFGHVVSEFLADVTDRSTPATCSRLVSGVISTTARRIDDEDGRRAGEGEQRKAQVSEGFVYSRAIREAAPGPRHGSIPSKGAPRCLPVPSDIIVGWHRGSGGVIRRVRHRMWGRRRARVA